MSSLLLGDYQLSGSVLQNQDWFWVMKMYTDRKQPCIMAKPYLLLLKMIFCLERKRRMRWTVGLKWREPQEAVTERHYHIYGEHLFWLFIKIQCCVMNHNIKEMVLVYFNAFQQNLIWHFRFCDKTLLSNIQESWIIFSS